MFFRVKWNSFHQVEHVPKVLLKAKVEHVPLSIKICLFDHWILFSMQNSLILCENWWLEKGRTFWKHQNVPFLSEVEVEHVPPLLLEERVELIPPEAKVGHVPLSIEICLFDHWILLSMQNCLILDESWWVEKRISFW